MCPPRYVYFAIVSTYRGFKPRKKAATTSAVKGGAAPASAVATTNNDAATSNAAAPTGRRRGGRGKGGSANSRRVEVDAAFFERLSRILAIVIPSYKSKEATMVAVHSFFLVFRTMLSLYVAHLDGSIVAALVRGQGKLFVKRIVMWMLVAVPVSVDLRAKRGGHSECSDPSSAARGITRAFAAD